MSNSSVKEAGVEYFENQDQQRGSALLVNIKVTKEAADLLKVFCAFNNVKMAEFATRILEKELLNFKNKLENLKEIK